MVYGSESRKKSIKQLSPRDRENAVNEVRLLASVRHPNIIAYKEAFVDEEAEMLW